LVITGRSYADKGRGPAKGVIAQSSYGKNKDGRATESAIRKKVGVRKKGDIGEIRTAPAKPK